MDIQKLKAFVDLTGTLSYTETAARLFTTQATISKQIIALEKELGVTLFDRKQRTIKITANGELLLKYASQITDLETKMREAIIQKQHDQSLDLTIKAIPSISNYKALELISEFHVAYPEVNLHISEAESYELMPALKRVEADVIFMRTFNINQIEFEMVMSETDEFVVVLPKNHQLAQLKEINISDLAAESFLMLSKQTNLYTPIMKLMQSADFKPEVIYEGRIIDSVLKLIKQGMGISIMMNKTVDLKEYSELVKIPLVPEVSSQLAFVRRKSDNIGTATDKFWKFLKAHHTEIFK